MSPLAYQLITLRYVNSLDGPAGTKNLGPVRVCDRCDATDGARPRAMELALPRYVTVVGLASHKVTFAAHPAAEHRAAHSNWPLSVQRTES
jgi:hypothetical protein